MQSRHAFYRGLGVFLISTLFLNVSCCAVLCYAQQVKGIGVSLTFHSLASRTTPGRISSYQYVPEVRTIARNVFHMGFRGFLDTVQTKLSFTSRTLLQVINYSLLMRAVKFVLR